MIFRNILYCTHFKLLITFIILLTSHLLNADQPQYISLSGQESFVIRNWKVAKYLPKQDFMCLPDSLWIPFQKLFGDDNMATGEWLIKAEIFISDSGKKHVVYGIFPRRYLTAYEIYWDGVKIGDNGKTGESFDKVVPGNFEYNLVLNNDLLTPGLHVIMYRISNFRNSSQWKWYNGWTTIAPYDGQWRNIFRDRVKAFVIMGLLFIPFLFNIFLYVTRKFKTEHLLFALLCLLVIIDHLIGQIPMFLILPATYTLLEFQIYVALVLINCILIPSFFIYLFSVPRKLLILLLVAIINIGIYPFIDIRKIYEIYPALILIESLLITSWALIKKKEGSTIILVGVIFSWIGYYYNMAFASLNTILVICTSLSIAIQFAKKEKGEREAQLRSSRLENELLKKNINSHFLMNTLTSIIVWLRRDPDTAIKLIEALANEFRMVLHISGLKEIPIRQEIELCNTHLKIMNYRKGAEYKLITEGINEEELIPPMIFHTIIENGLTHGFENKNCGTFKLSGCSTDAGTRYILLNDGDFNDCEKKNSSGFGLQYIKARLEESFPGKWNLESCRMENSWKVTIEIKK